MNIIDMHCDTIARLFNERRADASGDTSQLTLTKNPFYIDLDKMKRGGYLLQNFAIFTDQKGTPDILAEALSMIDFYYEELRKNEDVISPVFSWQDIERNRACGKMSAMLTMEEGAPLRGNLAHLRNFYRLGVRMIALTWNYENEIGAPNLHFDDDGLPLFFERFDAGLTEFGRECVCEMERLGMLVDVSHLSDGGFWDVAHTLRGPFVASHSNAAACCPVCRNLTDDMIRALAEHGGVAGLNLCTDFLQEPAGLDPASLKRSAGMPAQQASSEPPVSRLADMVRHVRHITNVGGIEVCGLGSDMDGIANKLEFGDASGYCRLADALAADGFWASEIDKIMYQNVLRVYHDVF